MVRGWYGQMCISVRRGVGPSIKYSCMEKENQTKSNQHLTSVQNCQMVRRSHGQKVTWPDVHFCKAGSWSIHQIQLYYESGIDTLGSACIVQKPVDTSPFMRALLLTIIVIIIIVHISNTT